MVQRRDTVFLVIFILLCKSMPLSQAAEDKKKNVWSLAETKIYKIEGYPGKKLILPQNEWHYIFSHENGDSRVKIDYNQNMMYFETNVHHQTLNLQWQHKETIYFLLK